MDEQLSVALIAALARVWSKIRLRHPDVPGVVLIPAPADRGRLNVLGHFAALRWRTRGDGDAQLHEVVVVAEHLNRASEDIVETLIHEAAHAMNFARGIKDCSPTSQYHNARFKEAAEELGLTVTKVKHYGYAFTTLAPETASHYVVETTLLEEALIHRRPRHIISPATPPSSDGDPATPSPDDEEKSTTRSRKATCACPFIIRVSKKTMDDTVIRCDSCGEPFQLV